MPESLISHLIWNYVFGVGAHRLTSPHPMKHPHSPRGGQLMTGMLAVLSILSQAFAASEIPRGTLHVDRDLVRVGAPSQLSWQIKYPAGVSEVIEILPPYLIKPKTDLKMRVRVLGASFQASATSFLPVELMWSNNSAAWSRAFYGRKTDVDPSNIVLETTVKAGDTIKFGGRAYRDQWLPLYHSAAETPNLVILQNGDNVPASSPAFQKGLIESFLSPYLASDKKTVKIGKRDLILLMELGQSAPRIPDFDLQDLAVLITFE